MIDTSKLQHNLREVIGHFSVRDLEDMLDVIVTEMRRRALPGTLYAEQARMSIQNYRTGYSAQRARVLPPASERDPEVSGP